MSVEPKPSNDFDIFKSDQTDSKESPELTKRGATLLGIFGGFFIGIYAVATPFVSPALRRICLPFVPATTQQVENVFTALSKRSGSLVDIGSGDGRIVAVTCDVSTMVLSRLYQVLEAARRGFKATGIELNYWLVLFSRFTAWRNSLSDQTNFVRQDLWKTKLNEFDNVVIFGVEKMMPELEKKLCKELSEGCNIVACRFPLPTWTSYKTVGSGVETVWLYIKGLENTDYSNS